MQDEGLSNENYSTCLYSATNSQYSHRVRLGLIWKNIAAKIIECAPEELPADAKKVNPDLMLPLLRDREADLYFANVILEYLEDRYPHPPILPSMPMQKAVVRTQIMHFDKNLSPSLDKLCNPGHARSDTLDGHRKLLRENMEGLSQAYKRTPYFFNEQLGISDLILLPMLWRLNSVGIELSNTPNTRGLRDFQKRIFELQWFRESLTPMELQMKQG